MQIELFMSKDIHCRKPLTECLLTYRGNIMDIMVCSAKSNLYVYRDGNLSIGEGLNTQIEGMGCMDLHPNGLFMVGGFEFSFKIICLLQNGVSVLHTEPISKVCQIKFTPFGDLFLIVSKSELRVYRFCSLSIVLVCELSTKNCEFTRVDIDTKGTEAVAVDSSNCMHFIDLLQLRKRRAYRFEPNTSYLGYDFVYDMVILTDVHNNIKVVRSLNAL